MKLRDRAKSLKNDIPALILCLKRADVPVMAKIIAAIAVWYALSPVDLIPDFIPVLGYLDDIIILPLLVALTLRLIPEKVLEECRVEVEKRSFSNANRWYYSLPVVAVWLLILWVIVKAIFL